MTTSAVQLAQESSPPLRCGQVGAVQIGGGGGKPVAGEAR